MNKSIFEEIRDRARARKGKIKFNECEKYLEKSAYTNGDKTICSNCNEILSEEIKKENIREKSNETKQAMEEN